MNIQLYTADQTSKSKSNNGTMIYIVFMPPLKKGAYCFATVRLSVGL